MEVLLVAWRYLIARPITLVAMSAVMVGLTAIVVVDSVMNGFLEAQRQTIRAMLPDVTVEVTDEPAARVASLIGVIHGVEGVAAVARRVLVPAMHRPVDAPPAAIAISGFGRNYFVELEGIDVAPPRRSGENSPSNGVPPDRKPTNDESAVIDLDSFLVHGANCNLRQMPEFQQRLPRSKGAVDEICPYAVARHVDPFWFDVDDPYWKLCLPAEERDDTLIPVIFGESLAIDFGYRPGTVITIATLARPAAADGSHARRTHKFVIVGTFFARDQSFELTHALVPRQAALEFAGLTTPADELSLRVAAGAEPSVVRDRLRARLELLGVDPERVKTWTDRKQLLLKAVESERKVMNVAMFFVVVVATFSLFMTLHQMVRLKTRDLGVLVSLGAPPVRVGRLFFVCGLMVTSAGAVLGFAAGLALTRWLNDLLGLVRRLTGFQLFNDSLFDLKTLPTQVDLGRIGWYVLGTIVCGSLFTLFPSLAAARLDPVEALRHE